MAGRYLVTGVQLGMLIGLKDTAERQSLVSKIDENQYCFSSNKEIKRDCSEIRRWKGGKNKA